MENAYPKLAYSPNSGQNVPIISSEFLVLHSNPMKQGHKRRLLVGESNIPIAICHLKNIPQRLYSSYGMGS